MDHLNSTYPFPLEKQSYSHQNMHYILYIRYLFVKYVQRLFIYRAPWIQILLSLRLQRDSQSLPSTPNTGYGPTGSDRHEWMITRMHTTVMLFEAKRAARKPKASSNCLLPPRANYLRLGCMVVHRPTSAVHT